MDTLAAIRSFIRAVDLGSFSKAAAEAGIKVSTVSRHISSLEDVLGAALLNRSTHGINLTEIGRMFHEHANRIVLELDEALALASSFNTVPQGLLKITAPAAFGRLHVVPHLASFLAEHPAISIDATLTDTHLDLIESGFDVALRIGTLPSSALIARKLARQDRILCASPAYVAAHSISEPDELSRHEALIFSQQPGRIWYFRHRTTGEQRAVKLSGRFSVNDAEALRIAVIAGQGFALLPKWLVHTELARGTLLALLPDWEGGIVPDFEQGIWAVYPPKKVVSPKVRAFIAFFEARFHKPVYWDDVS